MLAAASYFERDDASVWLLLHPSIVVDAVFGTRVILAVIYDTLLFTTFAAVSFFERVVQQRRRLAAASFIQTDDACCCIFVKQRINQLMGSSLLLRPFTNGTDDLTWATLVTASFFERQRLF